MTSMTAVQHHRKPSLAFAMLTILLVILWLAGGASRGDVLGQIVVRGSCWAALIVFLLFVRRPSRIPWPIVAFLSAALILVSIQLVPMPPRYWGALPGRAVLFGADIGVPAPWRPWSMVPGATINAAASLVVPITVVLLAASLAGQERHWLLGLLLALVASSSLIGLLQFSGMSIDNPFVNATPTEVSGTFANRNHFALFVTFGCLLAPLWAFGGGRASQWRGLVAVCLILSSILAIFASGSRAGLLTGTLAVLIGPFVAPAGLRRMLSRGSRRAQALGLFAVVAAIGLVIALSIASGRALSLDRAFATDQGQDMRIRALPTVLAMIREYFPFGSGLGTFDPMFRMHEPMALLKPTYFNHAHDDWLELLIDGGLPMLLLVTAAVGWWLFASVRAWRGGSYHNGALPRAASAILLVMMIASIFDYPARTPMIMAVVAIAGLWLAEREDVTSSSALPTDKQHL